MVRTAIIVEDCAITMQTTKFFLNKLGIKNILTASNYNEFQSLLKQNFEPDLVITDWNIDKNLQGDNVISAISKFNVPIAVVSSEQEKKTKSSKCKWFKKPLNISDFTQWLQRVSS